MCVGVKHRISYLQTSNEGRGEVFLSSLYTKERCFNGSRLLSQRKGGDVREGGQHVLAGSGLLPDPTVFLQMSGDGCSYRYLLY